MSKSPLSAGSLRRDFPGRRWLIVFLRAVHIAAVVALSGAILAGTAPAAPDISTWMASMVLASGFAMLLLDALSDPHYLRTVAGAFIVGKFLLVVWLVLAPSAWLLWALIILSAIVSHAPASFRHAELY